MNAPLICKYFNKVSFGNVCKGCAPYKFSTAVKHQEITPIIKSFHKRPLPNNLIALSSVEGRRIFKEALDAGGMESYFPLAEQFITQSEPSYCSLSSLAMVLNALNFDPKRIWKGAWRWVSEDMLHCATQAVCGHSLEKVKNHGLNFTEFESLARCHGVKIQSFYACHSLDNSCGKVNFEHFKNAVKRISTSEKSDEFIVANFSRKFLGQTGDGHFSPIGGYHAQKNLALILDVARFKYPPFWVNLDDLWNSMAVIDKTTNLTRGYFLVSGWDKMYDPVKESSLLDNNSNTEVVKKVLESCPPLIRTWEDTKRRSHHDHHNHQHDHHHSHSHDHHAEGCCEKKH